MNHEVHEKAEIACAVCHNRVAHPQAEKYDPIPTYDKDFAYKDYLTMMDGCWRCHSQSNLFRDQKTVDLIKGNKNPPNDCRVCHNKDFDFPEGHLAPSWKSKHGAAAEANSKKCLDCHAAGKKFDNHGEVWCTICHDNDHLIDEHLMKELGL